jgi:ATP-dependent RNA helicase DDX18/HAS1
MSAHHFPQPKPGTDDISVPLEKLISKNYYLHQSAKDGYRSYLQAYASYSLKKIFDINKLDLRKVGKAYGFAIPPKVRFALVSEFVEVILILISLR